MYLERARLVGLGPFDRIEIDLCERPGEVRPLTLIYGEGGTGKTALLSAISATRPAHHVILSSIWRRPKTTPHSVCEWQLRAEDPERPHPLKVATPGVSVEGDEKAEQLRRREVVHFDRQVAEKGGFAFVGIPGTRRFPRSALVIGDPARTVLRADTRGAPGFQDQASSELTRPIKLLLAYAGLSAGLAGDRRGESESDPRTLGAALDEALEELLSLVGSRYRGLSPRTFEPRFETPSGELLPFDALPKQAQQLVCMATLPVHQLWVAGRGADPRESEGVVLIDDAELHLSPGVQSELPTRLRRVLPKAQWVLATSSSTLAHAAAPGTTLTLRRGGEGASVEAYEGELSLIH